MGDKGKDKTEQPMKRRKRKDQSGDAEAVDGLRSTIAHAPCERHRSRIGAGSAPDRRRIGAGSTQDRPQIAPGSPPDRSWVESRSLPSRGRVTAEFKYV